MSCIIKDIFLGPFAMTQNRKLGVDFSMPVVINEWTMVVPLRKYPNMKMIFTVFRYEIWLILIVFLPAFITIMGLADYIYYRKVTWGHLAAFAIRTAMVEAVPKPLPLNAKSYQKLLILSWTLPMFILATAYAGNMTALIAKPSLEMPVKDAEDLVSQSMILWTLTANTVIPYFFKNSAPGTVLRELYDQSEEFTKHDCYSARNEPFWKSGKYAMPCTGISVMSLMSFDYSQTGVCNFYKTPDIFAKVNFALAFQVCLVYCYTYMY